MLKYSATAPQKIANLHAQQSFDAHSFLYMKLCLFTNNCCCDVGMPACFSQFCWNLPFVHLRIQQYHIPNSCCHWQELSDWSIRVLLSGREDHAGRWATCTHTGPVAVQTWPEVQLLRCSQHKFHSWAQLPEVLLHLQLPDKAWQSQKLGVSLFTWSGCISISTYTSATTWLPKLFTLYEPRLIK